MSTLYFKNVSGDQAWENSANWFLNANGTGSVVNAPWVQGEDTTYLAYDLAMVTGQTLKPIIGRSYNYTTISAGASGICSIADVTLLDSEIRGGTFSGSNFYNAGGYIHGGTFSGAGFGNANYVYGGTFSGDGFTNNNTIDGGTFFGAGFTNNGYIYAGTFSGEGFTNSNTISGGTFSGAGFTNNGYISGGAFSGDGFTNDDSIWGGTFSGAGFRNNGYIYAGTFSGEGFTNSNTISGGTFSHKAALSIFKSGCTFLGTNGNIILQNQSAGVLDILGTGLA